MKKKKKKTNVRKKRKTPEGLVEFLAALGLVALVIVIVFATRSCSFGEELDTTLTSGIYDDTSAPSVNSPTTTTLDPLPIADTIELPIAVSDSLSIEKLYTATGYFPEDGTDDAIENVLALKLTNKSDKALQYLTFSLDANGESFKFSATSVPAGKSAYLFALERKAAPAQLDSVTCEKEFEIYFTETPSIKAEQLSCTVKNGSITVTNISDSDIASDIEVYYKSTAEGGYLGGITYRFRVTGGLAAGKSYNAYAPHALAHMTEIMFIQLVQYEE